MMVGLDSESVIAERIGSIAAYAPATNPDAKPNRKWIERTARGLAHEFSGKRPSRRQLAGWIEQNRTITAALGAGWYFSFLEPSLPETARMNPAAGAPRNWRVRPIPTLADLGAWLNLSPKELEWFGDQRCLEINVEPSLRHYRRHWEPKKDGSFRLIESPKPRLKSIQRAILRDILEKIPAHESAHGFQKGRSILTYAGPHCGQFIVLKMDLRNFFPAISQARVQNVFLTAGYPENVSRALAGLCTTVCDRKALKDLPREWRQGARRLYFRQHLPQGSPTSPMLANLCAFRLDCRLAGLAKAAGASYGRYADDLLFSGDAGYARRIERFLIQAMAVALEEGFEVHGHKTRVMRQGVAQSAVGLRLNARPNIPRKEFDLLKAILTNCVRHGPQTQNKANVTDFQAHLSGRIAHLKMVNEQRGAKLRMIFDRVSW